MRNLSDEQYKSWVDAGSPTAAEQWPELLRLRDLESALREARKFIADVEDNKRAKPGTAKALCARIDAALSAAFGEASGDEPWRRCPSTHCERRQECASPSDCIVKSRIDDALSAASSWTCKAKAQGTHGGNDPADCDWPQCGCDPAANRVLSSIEEQGLVIGPRTTASGEASGGDVWRVYPNVASGLRGETWKEAYERKLGVDCPSRPAPSESPNVERARNLLSTAIKKSTIAYENQLAQLRARIAELEKELDSARAEGIAAEKKRCADIAEWFEDHEDDSAVARCAGLIAEIISREAKP